MFLRGGTYFLYLGECKLTPNTKANTFVVGYENFCYTKIQAVLTLLNKSPVY